MKKISVKKLIKLFTILTSGNGRWLNGLRLGSAAATEHKMMFRKIGSCGTVIDIGANRGQFALAARRYFPLAKLVSFEPLPEPAEVYRAIFLGEVNTTLHQSAVGPTRGSTTMHLSAQDDSSSLLPITQLQNSIFPGTAECGTSIIKIGRLSDFVLMSEIVSPALLKIDVQGFELQALEGCEELLSRFSHIYVECSFVELYKGQSLADEVIAWLRLRNFQLAGAYNMSVDGGDRPIQADFLFELKTLTTV